MTAYCEAGFDPGGFWTMTPREVRAHLDGAERRAMRENDQRIWLAWHIAAFSRARKLPKFETLVRRRRRATAPTQTGWRAQLQIVELINAAAGGDPRKPEKPDS